jgi:hypothetical protein
MDPEESQGLIPQQNTPPSTALQLLIRVLNHSIFWYCGIIWLFLVIAVGAAYVLSLLGACTLSDCQSFLNLNNAILTGLFTVINLYALPGRLARSLALLHGKSGADGFKNEVPNNSYPKDLLAESYDPSTFYHFTASKKILLVVLLLTSAFAQFINQVHF